jgi:hypothetical protein
MVCLGGVPETHEGTLEEIRLAAGAGRPRQSTLEEIGAAADPAMRPARTKKRRRGSPHPVGIPFGALASVSS